MGTLSDMNKMLRTSLRMPVKIDEAVEYAARERGAAAEQLLKNEAFTEALADVEKVYLGAWRNSSALDVDLRERAHIAVSLLADIKNVLIARVHDGKIAQKRIQASLEAS